MEVMVMASPAGMPVAEAQAVAEGGGEACVSETFNGLFAAELARLLKNGKTGKEETPGDALALLMAALLRMPGALPPDYEGTAAQGKDGGAVQGAESTGAGPAGMPWLPEAPAAVAAQAGGMKAELQAGGMEAELPAGGQASEANAAAAGAAQGNDAAPGPLAEIRRLFAESIGVDAAAAADPMEAERAAALPALPDADGAETSGTAVMADEGAEADVLFAGPAGVPQAVDAEGEAAAGVTEATDAPATPEAPLRAERKARGVEAPAREGFGAQKADAGEDGDRVADATPDLNAGAFAPQGKAAQTVGDVRETGSPVAAARTAEEAFDAVVESIASVGRAAGKEMEIRLKPEFLGRVVIKISMEGDGLVARIAASNPKVQDAFLSQAAALQNTLADQGLKDVRIVVVSSSVPDASLQQQADRRGQERREQSRRGNAVVVDAVEQPAARVASAYELAYRTGSVNRLA